MSEDVKPITPPQTSGKTYASGAIVALAALVGVVWPEYSDIVWKVIAFGAGLGIIGFRHALAKQSRALLIFGVCLLAGCATATPTAGQGDNFASAASGSAYSGWHEMRVSGTTEMGNAEATRIPLVNEDGEPILTPAGNPVYIYPGKGVRDIYINSTIDITSDIQQSGSTEGTTQTATPSTQTNPSATIPVP